jgi:RNA polymerase sigma-70 factor (ECF subfamily)
MSVGSPTGTWQKDPATFFREFYSRVHRFISVSTGAGPSDIEDLTQETLLQAWKDRKRFRGEASPLTWVLVIARNRTGDFGRRELRRRASDEVALALARMDAEDVPEELLENQELGARIRRALSEISQEHARLLLRRYVDGLAVRAIAEEKGESESAVESRLRRACEAFRRRLQKEGGENV